MNDVIREAADITRRIGEIEKQKEALSTQFRSLGDQQEKLASRLNDFKGELIGKGLFEGTMQTNSLYRTRNGSLVMAMQPCDVLPGVMGSVCDVAVLRGGHGIDKVRGNRPGSTYAVQWRFPTPEEAAATKSAEEDDEIPEEIRKLLARRRRHAEDDELVVNEAPDIWRLDGASFMGMYGMGIAAFVSSVELPT
jgi:hypothetical protein